MDKLLKTKPNKKEYLYKISSVSCVIISAIGLWFNRLEIAALFFVLGLVFIYFVNRLTEIRESLSKDELLEIIQNHPELKEFVIENADEKQSMPLNRLLARIERQKLIEENKKVFNQ